MRWRGYPVNARRAGGCRGAGRWPLDTPISSLPACGAVSRGSHSRVSEWPATECGRLARKRRVSSASRPDRWKPRCNVRSSGTGKTATSPAGGPASGRCGGGLNQRSTRDPQLRSVESLDIAVVVAATFALPGEFASWRRLRPFRRCAVGPVPSYETRVGCVRLRVVLTGIGHRAATAAVATAFQDRPDVFVAWGLAGGLNETLRVADIVAADRVGDRDGRRIDGDPRLLAVRVRWW